MSSPPPIDPTSAARPTKSARLSARAVAPGKVDESETPGPLPTNKSSGKEIATDAILLDDESASHASEPPYEILDDCLPEVARDNVNDTVTPPPIQIFAAESIIEQVDLVEEHSLPVRFWFGVCSVMEWLFGVVCMWTVLAVLASIPIVQFFSLGYLLEASGRVSRSGRLREGFIGIRPAARAGSLVLGTWIVLLPAQFASNMWTSAKLIDPTSGIVTAWQIGLFSITGMMVAHALLAWSCGGKLRYFFWPVLAPLFFMTWSIRRIVASDTMRPLIVLVVGRVSPRLLHDITTVPALTDWFPPAIFLAAIKRGHQFETARATIWEAVVGLRLQYYFCLGFGGLAVAFAWLFVPIALMIATTKLELDNADAAQGLGVLAGLTGSFLLGIVLLYLPFLQAHFAAERRFRAFLEIGRVRQLFRNAPIALTFSLLITLAFALPLYLLKIENVPSELLWALSLVFVAFGFPARLVMGWAMGRAGRRKDPRHFLSRWISSFVALPIIGFYVFFVYFSQYYVWNGAWSLFEQHAFLPPVPFLGLFGG